MKGVILCAGKGTRLKPITNFIPKPLIPIANKPFIFYTIESLLKAGVDDIAIVVNEENIDVFKKHLKHKFQKQFEYIIQKESNGIAKALLETESFINDERFIMILGDNSFELDLGVLINDFNLSNIDGKLFLKEVKNPEKFGVAYVGNNKIINLVEKPKQSFSNLAITGIYLFDKNIFKACKEIKVSKRGEYEITDAIKWLLENNYDIGYEIIDEYWRDVGSYFDLIEENINKLNSINSGFKNEQIINSHISGKIFLEKGASISNSIVRGPVRVGKNSSIKNSYIGPYTSIGKYVSIEKSNIECSIILDNCSIISIGKMIDNSILGEGTIIMKKMGIKDSNSLITGTDCTIYL